MTDREASTSGAPVFEWTALVGFAFGTPVLLWAINAHRGARIALPLVVATVVLVAAAGIAWVITPRVGIRRALLAGSAAVIIFYNWQLLADVSRSVGATWLPTALVAGAIWVAVLLMLTRLGRVREVAAVTAAVSAGSLVAAAAFIIGQQTSAPTIAVVQPSEVSFDSPPTEDVLILVLDAYARTDVLADQYGFDNRGFESELRQHGFMVVPGATTNYSMTIAALSSALALEYTVEEGTPASVDLELGLREILGGGNTLMRSFDDQGYEIVYFESGWQGTQCGAVVDRCVSASIYDELAGILIDRTPFAGVAHSTVGHPFTYNAIRQLDALQDEVRRASDRPRLIIAHISAPHPPLHLESDCSVESGSERSGAAIGRLDLAPAVLAMRKALYTDQLECISSKVLEVVESMPDDMAALVTADHGPDSAEQALLALSQWNDAIAEERFGIFMALRLADGCEVDIPDYLTLVNSTRLLLRCLGATGLDPLPDQNFVYPHPPGATDDSGTLRRTTLYELPESG